MKWTLRSFLLLTIFSLEVRTAYLWAQDCHYQLTGVVLDEHDSSPLLFSTIYVEETGQGVVADSNGAYTVSNLCNGVYHITVSHVGCQPLRQYIHLNSDSVLHFRLEHHAHLLTALEVSDHNKPFATSSTTTLSEEQLEEQEGRLLSDMLEGIPGVRSIKSGSGVAKPIIQGLSGNRINVINNGVAQSGQQWGGDHAPEIDPFSADRIRVIKGVDAITYGGNGLGGMVLVEPSAIAVDPHLHGRSVYQFNSNGREHVISTRLEQGHQLLHWRVTGTFKQSGDRRAPSYYLTNTGSKETNVAMQLSKRNGERWLNEAYYSYFSTSIGILRGAHLGNLSDLQLAIEREEPLYTKSEFRYTLDPPRQEVAHHLLKYKGKLFFHKHSSMGWMYAGQLNQRKEFDVRRGNRSEVPALDLQLQAHVLELQYNRSKKKGRNLKSGLQYKWNVNANDPTTGVLPLIPDYSLQGASAFLVFHQTVKRLQLELGGRTELLNYVVDKISITQPYTVSRETPHFLNYSLALGMSYPISTRWNTTLNTGFVVRSPEVNELYSFGLHQGVSGIEEGNSELKVERSLKSIWSNSYAINDRFELKTDVYAHYISDYIFLEPQEAFRLTIRGAFPVFLYQQTNALIHGVDVSFNYRLSRNMQWITTYALVRGNNLDANEPLVYMPSDRISTSIRRNIALAGSKSKLRLSVLTSYVFRQDRINANQDFLAPPAAYFLAGCRSSLHWGKRQEDKYQLFVQVDNLLNAAYRDYLDRMRYYADAQGRAIRMGMSSRF